MPLRTVSVGCTGCVIADRRGSRNMVKIIVAPGNGGCGQNTLQANWYGWFHGEMLKRGHDSVCPNWPDAMLCRESQWVPFVVDTLGVDENTIVVGHSTGALLAMRLAESHKLLGIILVSAAHTDLGDSNERASEYFDKPWNFELQKKNVQWIHQFHSIDDHLIPVDEARYIASQLKGNNHTYEELSGHSHFFEPFQPLLDAVDKYVTPRKI